MSVTHTKLMRPSSLARLVSLAFLVAATAVSAELAVIADNGNTRPMSDYIKSPKVSLPAPIQNIDSLAQDYLTQLFPVHTPQLSPGTEASRSVNLNLTQAVFILGTDPVSRQWLTQYRDRLSQIGAIGLVVDVQNLQDYKNLQALAGTLVLSPINGSELAVQLNITHYPVLVTAQRIEQ